MSAAFPESRLRELSHGLGRLGSSSKHAKSVQNRCVPICGDRAGCFGLGLAQPWANIRFEIEDFRPDLSKFPRPFSSAEETTFRGSICFDRALNRRVVSGLRIDPGSGQDPGYSRICPNSPRNRGVPPSAFGGCRRNQFIVAIYTSCELVSIPGPCI